MVRMDLVNALREAAAELNALGAAPLLDDIYDDREDLADYLASAAVQMEQGNTDAEPELRRIFAPTSVLDDAAGCQDLANKIHRMLDTATAASPPSTGAVAAQRTGWRDGAAGRRVLRSGAQAPVV